MQRLFARQTLTIPMLLAGLALTASASAQTTASASPEPSAAPSTSRLPIQRSDVLEEVSGNALLGVGSFDTGGLEDRLRTLDYDDVKPLAVLVGGEARFIFDFGLMLGATGAVAGHQRIQGPTDYDAQLSYRTVRGEVGYAVLQSERWLLLPKLGVGGYSVLVHLYDDRDAGFDELVEAPGTTTNISSGGLLMSGVLECDLRFPLGRPESHPRFFLSVGLQGGYLYSVPFGTWQSTTGAEVDDGPDADFKGGFGALTLGGGAFGI